MWLLELNFAPKSLSAHIFSKNETVCACYLILSTPKYFIKLLAVTDFNRTSRRDTLRIKLLSFCFRVLMPKSSDIGRSFQSPDFTTPDFVFMELIEKQSVRLYWSEVTTSLLKMIESLMENASKKLMLVNQFYW